MNTPTVNRAQPVALSQRVAIIDILRGFALFGILAVNIYGFASPIFLPGYQPAPTHGVDSLAYDAMRFFFEGKFYVIFSFLFGLGFSLQMSRAQAKGIPLASFYPRRLAWLFGFGVLHACLLFLGDILRTYAILGLLLLLVRRWRSRTLLLAAGALLVINFILLGMLWGPAPGGEGIPGMDIVAMARQVYTGPALLPVILFQGAGSIFSLLVITLAQGGTVLALFFLGMVVGRQGYLENLAAHRRQLRLLAAGGLALGLAGNALYLAATHPWLMTLGFSIGSPTLATAYCCGLGLLWLRCPACLAPIGQVGRMALSNYILQSLICSLIFNGYGFGLYEQVGPLGLWGVVIAIYLLQIPLSLAWLSRFQFGPLEWVWRALTYRQRHLSPGDPQLTKS